MNLKMVLFLIFIIRIASAFRLQSVHRTQITGCENTPAPRKVLGVFEEFGIHRRKLIIEFEISIL